MKKILILCIFALSAYCVSFFIPSAGELSIYDDVIRLHVIANSDDGRDQEEKMRVRDAVLDVVSRITQDAETKSDAEEMILSSLDKIEASAQDTLVRDGFDDTVTVTLSNEKYPRRIYGAVTLPAGTYTSLRVMIGDADGANFWCVLFPKLCTAPAIAESGDEDEFVEAGFTPVEYRLITKSDDRRYVIKFKLVEMIGELMSRARNR